MKKLFLAALLSFLSLTAVHAPTGRAEDKEADRTTLRVSPAVRYVGLEGDDEKFREDWWMEDEWAGGLEALKLRRQLGKDTSLELDARAIAPESDYKFQVGLFKEGLGSLRSGSEIF